MRKQKDDNVTFHKQPLVLKKSIKRQRFVLFIDRKQFKLKRLLAYFLVMIKNNLGQNSSTCTVENILQRKPEGLKEHRQGVKRSGTLDNMRPGFQNSERVTE